MGKVEEGCRKASALATCISGGAEKRNGLVVRHGVSSGAGSAIPRAMPEDGHGNGEGPAEVYGLGVPLGAILRAPLAGRRFRLGPAEQSAANVLPPSARARLCFRASEDPWVTTPASKAAEV
jgi:hypothetical protein